MADTTTTGKGVVTSKTFWANIIAGLLGFAPQVQSLVSPQTYTLGVIGMNLALRLITKQPITGLFNIPS